MKKIFYIFLLIIIFTKLDTAQGQNFEKDSIIKVLLNMNLEELMKVEVKTSNITGIEQQYVPASITTITSKDIILTPAKNIYDLLEIFVPGVTYSNHYEHPHPVIRGIIIDRNYKFLLLVNGVNVNQKSHNGASTELENWDLDDIEKIDVIRGPGSITYGPGAIAGVISITTKNSSSQNGFSVKAQYTYPFNSSGGNISYAKKVNTNFEIYGFASIISTKGFTANQYTTMHFSDSASGYYKFRSGYWGKDFNDIPNTNWGGPNTYLRDFEDKPQVKTQVEFKLFKEFSLSARYVNSGATIMEIYPQSKPVLYYTNRHKIIINGKEVWDGTPVYGPSQDVMMVGNRMFMTNLRNNHELKENIFLNTSISWYSHDFNRHQAALIKEYPDIQYTLHDSLNGNFVNSMMNPRFYMQNFCENELRINSTINWHYSDNFKAAFGFEFANTSILPGWGDKPEDFKAGDASNIISGPNSPSYPWNNYVGGIPVGDDSLARAKNIYFVGDKGFSLGSASTFGEVFYSINHVFSILVSGRIDKTVASQVLFSPRFALISNINEKNSIKIVAQQSLRNNTLEQLYIQKVNRTVSTPEALKGLEIIWTRLHSANLLFTFSTFYNSIDVLGWNQSTNNTDLNGNMKLLGFEPEIKYESNALSIGANHSYLKMLQWEKSANINVQGVSAADFSGGGYIGNSTLTGTGSSIANSPENSTKLWGRYGFLKNKLILFSDMQVFWKYQWGKDMLKMYQNGALKPKDPAKPSDLKQFNNLVADLNKHDAFGMNLRINMSVIYNVNQRLSLGIYCMNLYGTGNNKRYTIWPFWYGYPKVTWVEEPTTFLFKAFYSW